MTNIAVLKRGLNGEVTWRYEGQVLERGSNFVLLEAYFNRDDMLFMDIVLKREDRFVEWFYTDRWYNIFEIYDRDDEKFKGWYCNVGFPAVLEKDKVSYIDLALDLWVSPDGVQKVLDEDEFLAMPIDVMTRVQATSALKELQQMFKNKKPPVFPKAYF